MITLGLYTSERAGYATAWSQIDEGQPPAGAVVGKALARSTSETGQVQALVGGD